MVVYLLVLCLNTSAGQLCPTLAVWVSDGQCQTMIDSLGQPITGRYECRPEWVQGVIPGE